jgi:hypothetical protein
MAIEVLSKRQWTWLLPSVWHKVDLDMTSSS